jgi:hypothetical protein
MRVKHNVEGGHFFRSSNVPNPPNNGAILNIAQISDAIISLAAETELGVYIFETEYLNQEM